MAGPSERPPPHLADYDLQVSCQLDPWRCPAEALCGASASCCWYWSPTPVRNSNSQVCISYLKHPVLSCLFWCSRFEDPIGWVLGCFPTSDQCTLAGSLKFENLAFKIHWSLATKVLDEEKAQSKALNYLIQILKANAWIEYDFCHSYWNIFKRASNRLKMQMPLLKATISCPWIIT